MLVENANFELQVGEIRFHGYEALKSQALSIAEEISNVTNIDEDNFTEAKKTLAELNKAVNRLEKQRIEIKKRYLIPYDNFEKKVKDIVKIVNDADDKLRSAVKKIEQKHKDDKLVAIKKMWDHKERPEFLKFEQVMDPRFLNKTFDMAKIDASINSTIEKVNDDLSAIKSMQDSSELLAEYIDSLSLAEAVKRVKDRKDRLEKARLMEAHGAPEPVRKRTAFIIENDFIAEQVEDYLKENGFQYEKKEL